MRNFVGDFFASWARGTALYGKWAAEHGISYVELSVLYALVTSEAVTQKIICEQFGLPKQTVNYCIRDFKNEGFIRLETNERDKREKCISLTEKGDSYARSILTPLFEIEAYISRNISSGQFIQAIETRELFNTLFENAMKKETSI